MKNRRCSTRVAVRRFFTFLYYFDGNNNEADRITDRLIAARKNTRPTNEAATDRCVWRRDNGAVIPLVVGGVWDVFQGYINTRAAEVLTIKAKR